MTTCGAPLNGLAPQAMVGKEASRLGLTLEFEALLKAVGAHVLADACNQRGRVVSMPSGSAADAQVTNMMVASTDAASTNM